ncbi:hypothetical protein IAU59_003910 [Kwoniella sp. CBS 9459]
MGPGAKMQVALCGICAEKESKYRCSACPIRYCSVACYKQHKVQHEDLNPVVDPAQNASASTSGAAVSTSIPISTNSGLDAGPSGLSHGESVPGTDQDTLQSEPDGHESQANDQDQDEPMEQEEGKKVVEEELKPLSSLLWPPEPDESLFTDPLKKEDPKPLRREELLRIATSPSLRTLLSTTSLPQILAILDTLPPNARHTTLSKLLGLDPVSLSKPGGTAASFLSGRESPPPLEELLYSLGSQGQGQDQDRYGAAGGNDDEGWWLRTYAANHQFHNNRMQGGGGRQGQRRQQGQQQQQEQDGEKIWIGPKEREVVRLFARSVCAAIDGTGSGLDGSDDPAWGSGGLEWQV